MPLGLAKVGAEELRGERGWEVLQLLLDWDYKGPPSPFGGTPKWVQYGKSRVSSRSAERMVGSRDLMIPLKLLCWVAPQEKDRGPGGWQCCPWELVEVACGGR